MTALLTVLGFDDMIELLTRLFWVEELWTVMESLEDDETTGSGREEPTVLLTIILSDELNENDTEVAELITLTDGGGVITTTITSGEEEPLLLVTVVVYVEVVGAVTEPVVVVIKVEGDGVITTTTTSGEEEPFESVVVVV